jgi:predicted kinase
MSTLIILCGQPYAGKTTLGSAIVAKLRYETVDVDVTKDQLYGPGRKDDDLTHEQWVRIYAETDQQIGDYLYAGHSVVDDSRNFRKFERVHARVVADRCGASLVTIYVKTPEEILRQRLHENRRNPTRHDIEDDVFEQLLTLFEPPTEDEYPLVLNYGDRLEAWITAHSAELS